MEKNTTSTQTLKIYLLAKPGVRQRALRTYLSSFATLNIAGIFEDYPETLQSLQHNSLDLMILDWCLPDQQMVDLIKQSSSAALVILIDNPEQEQTARRAGAQYVFRKGALSRQLQAVIDEYSLSTG